MAKRSKASYRRAALKGHRTRRANFRKRSLAAKKGWRTQKANERKGKHAKKEKIEEIQGGFDSPG